MNERERARESTKQGAAPETGRVRQTEPELETGATVSYWASQTEPLMSEPLATDVEADVCVVGGGIAGLTTAYLLSHSRRVVLLERDSVGGGESGRTTAHLTRVLDARYATLAARFGEDGARIAAESHGAAIECIERVVREEGIDCGFRRVDGYLFAPSGGDAGELRKELEAARRAGLADVEMAERAPLPGFDTGPCLRFPGQAQFEPLRYQRGLAEAILRHGGRIHCATAAHDFEHGSTGRVVTAGGPAVRAAAVVLATNTPVNHSVGMHTKQHAYRTYVIGARVPRGEVPPGLYWDTAEPYHYARLAEAAGGKEMLLVGGEDHKTGQADDAEARYTALAHWASERFPSLGPVEFRWSGQIMEPVDGLGFIGPDPGEFEGYYLVTGHSGNGMTYGTLAGMLLAGLITEGKHPWASLYDPARKSLRAPLEYAKENLNTAAQYGDWLTGGDVGSEASVLPGHGAVVRRGAAKVAIYRDADGTLVERSAVCRHLGCIVRWNSGERSWDCPCHGSRYDATGRVLNGPANDDLEPAGG